MKSPVMINEQSSLVLKDVVVKLSSGKVAVSKTCHVKVYHVM
jgi:hypothetical protein